MADPEFPVVGRQPRRGADSRDGYVSKNLYVETKQSGPLWVGVGGWSWGVGGGSGGSGAPWIRQCAQVMIEDKIHR